MVLTPAIMTRPHVGTRSLWPKKIRLRPRTASLPGERKGAGAWEERPHTCEATPALSALDYGFGTFAATLRGPTASFTFAREQL